MRRGSQGRSPPVVPPEPTRGGVGRGGLDIPRPPKNLFFNKNKKHLKKFKEIQLPLNYKKKKSHFIIKNDFTKKSIKDGIEGILKEIK